MGGKLRSRRAESWPFQAYNVWVRAIWLFWERCAVWMGEIRLASVTTFLLPYLLSPILSSGVSSPPLTFDTSDFFLLGGTSGSWIGTTGNTSQSAPPAPPATPWSLFVIRGPVTRAITQRECSSKNDNSLGRASVRGGGDGGLGRYGHVTELEDAEGWQTRTCLEKPSQQ